MPRTPRNPGSGKPPSNAPARGPGHGGPAKGEGNHAPFNPVPPFGPENEGMPYAATNPPREPETQRLLLSPKGEAAELAAQEALGVQVTIMRNSLFEGNRKDAAREVMNRIWGTPPQTSILVGPDGGPIQQEMKITDERSIAATDIITRRLKPAEDAPG